MAVEVEASGQIDEFLRILRRRVWCIVIPFVVVGSLGVFYAVVVPKKFVSSTEVLVGSADGDTVEFAKSEGEMAAISLRTFARIDAVLNELNWTDYTSLTFDEQREYCEAIQENLRVGLPSMPKDATRQLVQISYKDTSPGRAHDFLQQLWKNWSDQVLQSQLNREKESRFETNELLDDCRKELQSLVEELKSERQEHNIAPPTLSMDGRAERPASPVFQTLEGVRGEIARLEDELATRERELELMEQTYARMPTEAPAQELSAGERTNQEIDKLDELVASLERRKLESDWSPLHSEFKRIDAEIRKLQDYRRELVAELSNAARSEPDGKVENPERLALGERIQREQDRLAQLRQDISRERVREADLEGRAFQLQTAFAKIDQLEARKASLQQQIEILEKRANVHDLRVADLDNPGRVFEVNDPPSRPTEPTDPDPVLISVAAIILGLGAGLGLAILKEYSRSVFRSPRELARVMTHPVLGTVNTIRTRRERARALLVRSVLGGGSLLFALSVGFVTWAWATDNQGALTDPLVDAIERFREMLM